MTHNTIFIENALKSLQRAYELLNLIDSELNASDKAQLQSCLRYSISIINICNKILYQGD